MFRALLAAVASFAAGRAVASPGFEGVWLGTVTAPNATAEIGFAFTRTEAGLVATFHMPAMLVSGARVGAAEICGASVHIRPLETRLTLQGRRLRGTFGPGQLPIELKRGGAFSPPPPAPPAPPGPAPVWTRTLAAEIWASPVVHDGTIFVGAADGCFHALRASDGATWWTWRGTAPVASAAVAGGERVYFLDGAAHLVALHARDGTLAWRTAVSAAAPPPAPANGEPTGAPVLRDGVLLVATAAGALQAVEARSGATLWRQEMGAPLVTAPGRASDELLVAARDGTVAAFDLRGGRELARARFPEAWASPPVVAGGVIVVGGRSGLLHGLDARDFTPRWRYSLWLSWTESAPALADGILYVGGSALARVIALDARTGRAKWSTPVGGLTCGTPLVTSDTVFAGTAAQRNALAPHAAGITALDRATGAVRWRREVPLPEGAVLFGYLTSLAATADLVIAARRDGTITAYPIR